MGRTRPAVYESAAVAAEPHRRNGGSPRCCPVLCGLRDRCIAAMLATRTRHEGGSRPPPAGRRDQACEVLADTGIRVARNGPPGRGLGEGWTSIRVARPVFRFGRPACISQHLCSKNGIPCWNCTSLCGFAGRRLNCSANGIEIGVTNRIRTGTNAFTGRDAAVTS